MKLTDLMIGNFVHPYMGDPDGNLPVLPDYSKIIRIDSLSFDGVVKYINPHKELSPEFHFRHLIGIRLNEKIFGYLRYRFSRDSEDRIWTINDSLILVEAQDIHEPVFRVIYQGTYLKSISFFHELHNTLKFLFNDNFTFNIEELSEEVGLLTY